MRVQLTTYDNSAGSKIATNQSNQKKLTSTSGSGPTVSVLARNIAITTNLSTEEVGHDRQNSRKLRCCERIATIQQTKIKWGSQIKNL